MVPPASPWWVGEVGIQEEVNSQDVTQVADEEPLVPRGDPSSHP